MPWGVACVPRITPAGLPGVIWRNRKEMLATTKISGIATIKRFPTMRATSGSLRSARGVYDAGVQP